MNRGYTVEKANTHKPANPSPKPLLPIPIMIVFTFISVITFLFFISFMGSAETIFVNGDGSGDHTRIQDAIDNATVGDTILVAAGNYSEKVNIQKSLDIAGAGIDSTFVSFYGHVFSISSNHVNLSGFSISSRGHHPNSAVAIFGDHNTVFGNNLSSEWNGILLKGRDNLVTGNLLTNNLYAIRMENADGNEISGNAITGNRAGMSAVHSDMNIISHNTFADNWETGISFHSCISNHILDNVFTDSGISLAEDSHSLVEGNTITNSGVGISVNNNGVGVILENNICNENNYNGISISQSMNCTIENCTVMSNGEYGYSIVSSDGCRLQDSTAWGNGKNGLNVRFSESLVIHNCIISMNGADGVELESGSGGHLTEDVLISDCMISGNEIGVELLRGSNKISLSSNNIFGNENCGIDASENSGGQVDARNNWWGVSSGPSNGSTSTAVEGDRLKGEVTYVPWLTSPYNYKLPVAVINWLGHGNSSTGQDVIFKGQGLSSEVLQSYQWSSSIDGLLFQGNITGSSHVSFTTSNLSVGKHTISFSVRDFFGGWAEPATISHWVRKLEDEPQLQITSLKNGDTVKGEIIITGTSFNPYGSVNHVEISIDRGQWEKAAWTATWEYNWDTTTVNDGKHTISVRYFGGGEYSENFSITVTVENEGSDGSFIPFLPLHLIISAVMVAHIILCRKVRSSMQYQSTVTSRVHK